MNHKIRLGPIAVFLAVIAAVVATLAILTFATSRADAALAERFAAVTAIRYELDEEGNRFLQAADELAVKTAEEQGGEQMLPAGEKLTGEVSSLDGGGWKYYTEKDGYALTVEVVPAAAEDPASVDAGEEADERGESGKWRIRKWKINKLWEGDDPFEDLWLG